jgi:hypothetical protein
MVLQICEDTKGDNKCFTWFNGKLILSLSYKSSNTVYQKLDATKKPTKKT